MADNAQVLDALQAYILSKKYTDETCNALGFVKGANATIKSIEKKDGQNIITFEWTGTDGTAKQQKMFVDDGTPIYVWESGSAYKYGDLVIYESSFYRCLFDNSDAEFDAARWQEINSTDGNYDIVANKFALPNRFTSADKKMFYAYEENIFYFWNGTEWVAQKNVVQRDVMPAPSSLLTERIVQYVGASDEDYTRGYFYECKENGGMYFWTPIETQDVKPLTDAQLREILSLF